MAPPVVPPLPAIPPPGWVVVIAASAGGIAPIVNILSKLPADFPAAVLVAQHLAPSRDSSLDQIIRRNSALPTEFARDGVTIEAGHTYIAPPDLHLLMVERDVVRLTSTERVQWVRPSADVLFESVAALYGSKAVAVVLSGTGRDGSAGAMHVKRCGGRVIVQEPTDAAFAGMPSSAAEGTVDHVVPVGEIAQLLVDIVGAG